MPAGQGDLAQVDAGALETMAGSLVPGSKHQPLTPLIIFLTNIVTFLYIR